MESFRRQSLQHRMPRAGEVLRIYRRDRLIASGYVISADRQTICVAGKGIIDLNTDGVRRGLRDGSIRIERTE
jgi:hypothetical protein